jgi:hypothetical protein
MADNPWQTLGRLTALGALGSCLMAEPCGLVAAVTGVIGAAADAGQTLHDARKH